MKSFIITAKDVEALDEATTVLRDFVKGGPGTAESLQQARFALMGLLTVIPQPIQEPTWTPMGVA